MCSRGKGLQEDCIHILTCCESGKDRCIERSTCNNSFSGAIVDFLKALQGRSPYCICSIPQTCATCMTQLCADS